MANPFDPFDPLAPTSPIQAGWGDQAAADAGWADITGGAQPEYTPESEWQQFMTGIRPQWRYRQPLQAMQGRLQSRYMLERPYMGTTGPDAAPPTFRSFLNQYGQGRRATPAELMARAREASDVSTMTGQEYADYAGGFDPQSQEAARAAWYRDQYGTGQAAGTNRMALANLLALQRPGGQGVYSGSMADAIRNSMYEMRAARQAQDQPGTFLDWYLGRRGAPGAAQVPPVTVPPSGTMGAGMIPPLVEDRSRLQMTQSPPPLVEDRSRLQMAQAPQLAEDRSRLQMPSTMPIEDRSRLVSAASGVPIVEDRSRLAFESFMPQSAGPVVEDRSRLGVDPTLGPDPRSRLRTDPIVTPEPDPRERLQFEVPERRDFLYRGEPVQRQNMPYPVGSPPPVLMPQYGEGDDAEIMAAPITIEDRSRLQRPVQSPPPRFATPARPMFFDDADVEGDEYDITAQNRDVNWLLDEITNRFPIGVDGRPIMSGPLAPEDRSRLDVDTTFTPSPSAALWGGDTTGGMQSSPIPESRERLQFEAPREALYRGEPFERRAALYRGEPIEIEQFVDKYPGFATPAGQSYIDHIWPILESIPDNEERTELYGLLRQLDRLRWLVEPSKDEYPPSFSGRVFDPQGDPAPMPLSALPESSKRPILSRIQSILDGARRV